MNKNKRERRQKCYRFMG